MNKKEQAKLIIGPRLLMDDVTNEQKLVALRIRHTLELWAKHFDLTIVELVDIFHETIHEAGSRFIGRD